MYDDDEEGDKQEGDEMDEERGRRNVKMFLSSSKGGGRSTITILVEKVLVFQWDLQR